MVLPRESRRLDFAAGGEMWLDVLVVVVLTTGVAKSFSFLDRSFSFRDHTASR
jgi:hypothetical protein